MKPDSSFIQALQDSSSLLSVISTDCSQRKSDVIELDLDEDGEGRGTGKVILSSQASIAITDVQESGENDDDDFVDRGGGDVEEADVEEKVLSVSCSCIIEPMRRD